MNCNNSLSNDELVSIIIPVYNGQFHIERAILSCINQKYKKLQIIIVNDGSTDQTEQVIKKYMSDKRIEYVYQKNSERSAARNAGLKLSKGKYIQFLDADDQLELDKIELHVKYLQAHPSTSGVYGPTIYVNNGIYSEFHYKRNDRYHTRIWITNFIPINAMLLRLDSTLEFKVIQKYLEDWRYIIDYFKKNGPIEPTNYGKCIVNLHDDNTSNNVINMKSAAMEMLKEMLDMGVSGNKSASSFQYLRLGGVKNFCVNYGVIGLLKTTMSCRAVRLYATLLKGKLNAVK